MQQANPASQTQLSSPSPLTASQGCQDAALLNEWHAVGFSDAMVAGELYPITLLGRDLVGWRDTAGALHIWEDLCVHRGAKLSKGQICDDQVVCPYHGWRYDGVGICTLISAAPDEPPMAKARAFTHRVIERYGLAWACLGEPVRDIPNFPEWDDAAYVKVPSGPYAFKANAFRSLENFMDVSHFPFVHGNLNGIAGQAEKLERYSVAELPFGLKTSEITVFQPVGDARGVPVKSNYTFMALGPLVAHFVKRIQDVDEVGNPVNGQDTHFATLCAIQMVDEGSCILRVCAALDVKPAPDAQVIKDRADIIFTQDREIVETQRPERIPTELRYELHHRSDLLGQRYRKWLRALDITYGAV